jgi:hypothetical protein
MGEMHDGHVARLDAPQVDETRLVTAAAAAGGDDVVAAGAHGDSRVPQGVVMACDDVKCE